MPSSRYTPSAYGDIDSGGWDNLPPHHQVCKGPRRFTPPPRNNSWDHDMCQDCGHIGVRRSNVDPTSHHNNDRDRDQPRGRGQLRAPSIDNDNWAPAPVRKEPVLITPPQSNGGDDWGPTPTTNHNDQQVQKVDDADGWGAPAPAPAPPAPRSNGNGNGNNHSAPPPHSQFRSISRYDDEEDYNEEDEIIPPPSTEPVYGAYVAWTGVT
jgi:hypothetical protein